MYYRALPIGSLKLRLHLIAIIVGAWLDVEGIKVYKTMLNGENRDPIGVAEDFILKFPIDVLSQRDKCNKQ